MADFAEYSRRFTWPLILWFFNRLLLVLTAWLSLSFLPAREAPELWHAYPGNNLLNGWLRWDSGWYLTIARDGYAAPADVVPGRQRNTAFFPLYPLLTRGVSRILHDNFAAGLVVSNVAFLLALLILYESVRETRGEEVARKTASLLLFHPCSFFFSAMYTESLFLMLAVLALRAARREHWLAAGLWAALAGGTRVVGVLLVAALAVGYMESVNYSFKRIRASSLWILLGLLGPLAYMGFLAHRYGNPFEFAAAQDAAGWTAGMGFLPRGPMDFFQLIVLAVCVILAVRAWRSESRAEAAWATLMLVVSCTRWPSMSRLSLVIYPLYVAAAQWLRNAKVFAIAVIVSALMLLALTARFALWYWVA